MRTKTSPEALLTKGLQELSHSYSGEQVGSFMTYLTELKKWSKAYNLTSIRTDEDIITKHFLDSLLYLNAMPDGAISVMDIGSGAGFPGIPMKIMRPEIAMYLVEPIRKKAAFLKHIISALKLEDILVVEKRVEDLESMDVDVAVTRALFDIKDFCKKVFPVLERGGMLVISKGPKVNEELKAIEKEGLTYKVLNILLPLTDIKRFIVVIKKDAPFATSTKERHGHPANPAVTKTAVTCINAECRLRKAGCRGFEGCPGYKSKNP